MRHKVTVIGAGLTGRTIAQELARRDYANVVLVDIVENLPQGIALDLDQAASVLGYEPTVTGSNSYDDTAGSDVVVVTAGVPRKPGMSRDDLVTTNEKIVGSVTEQALAHSPDTIVIVLSNPLDAMCHVAKSASGLPKERVIGQAGILDTARFRAFIAWETGASVRDVHALVLGGHGDQMVPVVSATTVGGVPLTKLVSQDADRRDGRADSQGWRRSRRAPRHLGLVRAGGGGDRDGRGRASRSEAGSAVHRVPRRRVRGQRAVHGRPREARRSGDRGDRRARPLGAGAGVVRGVGCSRPGRRRRSREGRSGRVRWI